MKLLMVTECDDPYEPSATVALVESIEVAKALGFKELWQFIRRETREENLGKHGPFKIEYSIYKDLVSGTEFASSDGAHYPQPMIEWVETGVILGESQFTKGKIWYASPNKKKS